MSKVVAYKIVRDSYYKDSMEIWLLLDDNRLVKAFTGNVEDITLQNRARVDSYTIIHEVNLGISIEKMYKKYHLKSIEGQTICQK